MYKVTDIVIFLKKNLKLLKRLHHFIPEYFSSLKKPNKSTPPELTWRDMAPFFSTMHKQNAFKKHALLMIRHQLNKGLYHAVQDRQHFEFSWGLGSYKVVCKIYNYSKHLSLFFPNCLFCWESKQCQQKCQHFLLGKGHNILYISFGSLHAVFAL